MAKSKKKDFKDYVQQNLLQHTEIEYVSLSWKNIGRHEPICYQIEDAIGECISDYMIDNEIEDDEFWQKWYGDYEEIFMDLDLD